METIEEKRARFKAKYNARKEVIDKLNQTDTARLRRKVFSALNKEQVDSVYFVNFVNTLHWSADYAASHNERYANDLYVLRKMLRGGISKRVRALTCAYLHSIDSSLVL